MELNAGNASQSSARVHLLGLSLAIPVFAVLTISLAQFFWLLSIGQRLTEAAEAALHEAVLPRASHASVEAVAQRSLSRSASMSGLTRLKLSVGGSPQVVRCLSDARPGERIDVTLSVSAGAVVPDVLSPLGMSIEGQYIEVTLTDIKR